MLFYFDDGTNLALQIKVSIFSFGLRIDFFVNVSFSDETYSVRNKMILKCIYYYGCRKIRQKTYLTGPVLLLYRFVNCECESNSSFAVLP